MKKLRLVILAAATTALIPMAIAQAAPGNPGPGMRGGGGHHAGSRMGPRAGHSWGGGGMRMSRPHGAKPPQMHHGGWRMGGHKGGGGHYRGGGYHRGGKYGKFNHHRIHRGGKVSNHWFGSGFHVRNWNLYGFSEPFFGARWIRYYDDALLVDRCGRVYDGRYDMDWDRYGERWQESEDGIPAYSDDGDYGPEDRGDEWAEDLESGELVDEDGDYREGDLYHLPPPPPPQSYTGTVPPPPPPTLHYRYGPCGQVYTLVPVLMTETVVTTPAVVEAVTRYETVRTKARPAVRTKYRPVAPTKYRPIREK